MKALLTLGSLVFSTLVWAGSPLLAAPAAPAAIKGEVLEVKDVESYTYLRLKTKDGETWAAVPTAVVKKGASVSIENSMVMTNFESKTLKKTFPKILFGTLGGAAAMAPAASAAAVSPHAGAAKVDAGVDVKVPKASGANAYTVAELNAKGAALKDKAVVVRGKVVKYNSGIMGKNWIHLHDGTGSAASGNNDILVTTLETAKVGDVLTAQGALRTDKDFGAGYAYKVLVEATKLQK
jgi:hypothetical protein